MKLSLSTRIICSCASLWGLSIHLLLCVVVEGMERSSPYMIVIDGGSTGSRLHIFEFIPTTANGLGAGTNATSTAATTAAAGTAAECVRRGSARANIPLSGFGRLPRERNVPLNGTVVAEHLMPAFGEAAAIVPAKYHAATTVKYQATAGMRLLDASEQDAVYDALYEGLTAREDFVFTSMKRDDIATLSGDLEGYYGAVAANYLKGTVNANLELLVSGDHHHHEQHHHDGPYGALDMGGSSTQIVFLPSQDEEGGDSSETSRQQFQHQQEDEPPVCQNLMDRCTFSDNGATINDAANDQPTMRLRGDDFFVTSYLSYGVDQIRERLWNLWVHEHEEQQRQQRRSDGGECSAEWWIANPCGFVDHRQEWGGGYTLIGTGDAERCTEQVRRIIPNPHRAVVADAADPGSAGNFNVVGGVRHPAIRGKFLAMSLYFYALDCLRELSTNDRDARDALNAAWPTPSIRELADALPGLCSRRWKKGDVADAAHPFTRPSMLPHRCLESVYMVALLRDGFGFKPESRDVTFSHLVNGSEVEWSLGMALELRSVRRREQSADEEGVADSAVALESRDASFEGGGVSSDDDAEEEDEGDDGTKKELNATRQQYDGSFHPSRAWLEMFVNTLSAYQ